MRLAKSNSRMKNVACKNQTFSICGSMSRAMKVKTVNYHFSQCLLYAEIWAKQFVFVIPNVYFNAKREGPRKQSEPGQQAYWGLLLRTPVRHWPEQGWGDKEVATEASANWKWNDGWTGMNLQSCPELSWTKKAVPLYFSTGLPLDGFRLRLEREPNLGRDSSLEQRELPSRNSPGSRGQSLLQAAWLGWGGRLTSVSLMEEGSGERITCIWKTCDTSLFN